MKILSVCRHVVHAHAPLPEHASFGDADSANWNAMFRYSCRSDRHASNRERARRASHQRKEVRVDYLVGGWVAAGLCIVEPKCAESQRCEDARDKTPLLLLKRLEGLVPSERGISLGDWRRQLGDEFAHGI